MATPVKPKIALLPYRHFHLDIDSTYRNRNTWPLPSDFVIPVSNNSNTSFNYHQVQSNYPTAAPLVNNPCCTANPTFKWRVSAADPVAPSVPTYRVLILSADSSLPNYSYNVDPTTLVTLDVSKNNVLDTNGVSIPPAYWRRVDDEISGVWYLSVIPPTGTSSFSASLILSSQIASGTITLASQLPTSTNNLYGYISYGNPAPTQGSISAAPSGTNGLSLTLSNPPAQAQCTEGEVFYGYQSGTQSALDPSGSLPVVYIVDTYTSPPVVNLVSAPSSVANATFKQNDVYAIAPFAYDNQGTIMYSETRLNNVPTFEVDLLNLSIPNVDLSGGYSEYLGMYPYLYVVLKNESFNTSNTAGTILSNNPNSSQATFKIYLPNSTPPPLCYPCYVSNGTAIPENCTDASGGGCGSTLCTCLDQPFIILKDHKFVQTLKIRLDQSIRFSVLLPNGNPLQTIIPDNHSPHRPITWVQISASFSFRQIE